MLKTFNRAKSAPGYGLALLMGFLASAVLLTASSSLLLTSTLSRYVGSQSLNDSSAKQLAEEALDAAQADILTQQAAGTTITTSYRYPSSGSNTISVPTYPGSGASGSKGTYYVTTTYARGFSFLLKANVTVDSNTVSISRLFQLYGTSSARDVRFIGRNAGDWTGFSISNAGDVNGDGYDDILIGSYQSDGGGSSSGETYLILSRSNANWATLTDVNGDFNLDSLSDANLTVRFIGRNADDYSGRAVSSAGDVNNDGYDDILIGSNAADGGGADSGEAYLILGRSTANWAALTDAGGDFNLDNMSDANLTIRFLGRNAGDGTGYAISHAGDVNNDGYDDIIIGSYHADGGGSSSGEAYLILGRSTANWATLTDASGDFNLDNLSDANLTVRFIGRNAGDRASGTVSSAGDVNGDGYDDLLIGAEYADGGGADAGEAYLILGRSTANWATLTDASGDFNLDNLSDANLTVRFLGRNAGDEAGSPGLSNAGDVNGDGYDDILIGADDGDGGAADAGEVYLILGRSTANWATLTDASGDFNLDNLSDANLTVRFLGRNADDNASVSISNAGDVNNDGYDDILIAADRGDGGAADGGEAYLILGRSTTNWAALTDAGGDFNLDNLSDANLTVRFLARNASDALGRVSNAGDVNNDGYDDILIGANAADGGGADSGEVYLILGRSTANWATLTDAGGDFNLDNI